MTNNFSLPRFDFGSNAEWFFVGVPAKIKRTEHSRMRDMIMFIPIHNIYHHKCQHDHHHHHH